MKKASVCILTILLLLNVSGCNTSNKIDDSDNEITELNTQVEKITPESLEERNIFDPHNVKIGDVIGNFVVTDISIDDDYKFEQVNFEGELTITGDLLFNIVGGSMFGIICTKEEIVNNLPTATTLDLDKHGEDFDLFFNIRNDEMVIKEIGKERYNKMLENIENGVEVKYNIKAIFNNFTYRFQPETDMSSIFELVKIISIEEY